MKSPLRSINIFNKLPLHLVSLAHYYIYKEYPQTALTNFIPVRTPD